MNEETIIENRPVVNGQNESKKESSTWKHVTLGGVSGILMGAGLLYAGQATAATFQENETDEETPVESVEEA
jgi:L-aminopeptidase/D-esterase-like protein